MQKQSKNFKKGVTLVEVLVSIFIFSIMIASMTGIFATMIRKRSEIKQMQQRTEELSLAVNYIAKKVRMSTYKGDVCSSASCTVLDNSLDKKVTFSISGDVLKEQAESGAPVSIMAGVSGGFDIQSSDRVPRITIRLFAKDKPETSVQTTVSLRSY
jgi:prepilin-type N-terminal cleavage/methylation domain-containing protein